jgi:2-hydroxychromene-2-carboxylate isomerase
MNDIELFFDCSCVWAYYGLVNADRIAARHHANIILRPVRMMEVLGMVNQAFFVDPPKLKQAYHAADIREWASYLGIPLASPTPQAPVSEDCMLACIAAQRQGRLRDFATAAFDALWVKGRDLSQQEVLRSLWNDLGLPEPLFDLEMSSAAVAGDLQSNTRELMERGGFGVPTFFVGDDMYFGADTLPLLEQKLRRRLRGD